MELLVGAQERLALRLVALRLPTHLAAQRRRRAKARARRDRSLCPSQRYLKLLDWTILLTNVPSHHATAQPEARSLMLTRMGFSLGLYPNGSGLKGRQRAVLRDTAEPLFRVKIWLDGSTFAGP